MSLELIVLGCNGSGPGPDGPASGYLVRAGDSAVWMDAGTGTFMELTRYVDPADLAGVVLSHLHADHSADFFGFFHYVAYRTRPSRRIPVFLPPGAIDRLGAFLDADADHPFHQVLALEEVGAGDTRTAGALTLSFAPAAHSVPTNAIRVDAEGRSLVFSGDTGPGGGFPALAAGADLMLCEAGLDGERGPGVFPHHLSGVEAGALAAEAGVGRLVVTHVAPTLPQDLVVAQAARAFGGPTLAAVPGLQVTV